VLAVLDASHGSRLRSEADLSPLKSVVLRRTPRAKTYSHVSIVGCVVEERIFGSTALEPILKRTLTLAIPDVQQD
jgi:hypothetical protein